MPYDESLAGRVRPLLFRRKGFAEKKMFGGIGFLLHGNMCVGVWREYLILRLGIEAAQDALLEPGIRPFDITGKALQGWVMVEPAAAEDPKELRRRVEGAVRFVATLPAKE